MKKLMDLTKNTIILKRFIYLGFFLFFVGILNFVYPYEYVFGIRNIIFDLRYFLVGIGTIGNLLLYLQFSFLNSNKEVDDS